MSRQRKCRRRQRFGSRRETEPSDGEAVGSQAEKIERVAGWVGRSRCSRCSRDLFRRNDAGDVELPDLDRTRGGDRSEERLEIARERGIGDRRCTVRKGENSLLTGSNVANDELPLPC